MPSPRFFYLSTAGHQAGPFTGSELKQQAVLGLLAPGNPVWKEGSEKRVQASTVKGLFPDPSEKPATSVDRPSVSTPPELPANSTVDTTTAKPDASGSASDSSEARESATPKNTTLGSRLKTAATLAAKKAELTKLNWSTLPSLYGRLGRALFEANELAADFPAENQQIQTLQQKLTELQQESSGQTANVDKSLKSQATSMAQAVKRKAIQEKLKHQLEAAFAQFGKVASGADVKTAAASKLIQDIREVQNEVDQLESHVARLESSGGHVLLTPKRLLNAFVVLGLIGGTYLGYRSLFSRSNSPTAIAAAKSKIGQPITVDVDALSGVREVRDRLKSESDVIARRAAADGRQRREEAETSRKEQLEQQRRQEERSKQAESENLNASIQIRLENLRSRYVPRKQTLSAYPPRPRTSRPVKVLSRPTRSLSTALNHIDFVEVSPDAKLMAYGSGNHHTPIVAFDDLKPLSFDDGFLSRRENLGCYRAQDARATDKNYERHYRAEKFPEIMKEHLSEGKMIYRMPIFSNDNKWLASINNWPWSRCYSYGSSAGSDSFSSCVAVWQRNGNKLQLNDVYSINNNVKPRANEVTANLVVVDARKSADRLVLLTGSRSNVMNNSIRSRVRGDSLQVWKESGLIGTCSVTYSLGANQENPYQMALNPSNGQIALLYDHSFGIYDHQSIRRADDQTNPLKTLPLHSPSPDPHHRGSIAYSPDGSVLVVMIKSIDPAKGDQHLWIEFYDARTWSVLGSQQLDIDPTAATIKGFSPDGKYCALSARVTSSVFEMKEILIWNTHQPKLVQRVLTNDAEEAFFLDKTRLVTGSGRKRELLEISNRNQKQIPPPRDQTLQDVFVWEIETGQLLSQIVLRWVSALSATSDGRNLITAKDKFGNDPAMIEVWDLASGGEEKIFDPFDWERREEFRLHVEKSMGISIKAPYVRPSDVEGIEVGMSYDDVMKKLLGYGEFEAELVEVKGTPRDHKATGRMTVTYEAAGNPKSTCKFIFEGELFGEPYNIKLVKKDCQFQ